MDAKSHLRTSLALIALTSINSIAFAAGSGAASSGSYAPPYVQVNVNQNYSDPTDSILNKNDSIANLGNYLFDNNQPVIVNGSTSDPAQISYYVQGTGQHAQDENIFMAYKGRNIDEAAFQKLRSGGHCSIVNGNPNLINCLALITGPSKTNYVRLPILVSNQVRARNVKEFAIARQVPHYSFFGTTLPALDYLQISAQPADFPSGTAVPIVPLNYYFSAPSGQVVDYTFDASQFCRFYSGSYANGCTNPGARIMGLGRVYYLAKVSSPSLAGQNKAQQPFVMPTVAAPKGMLDASLPSLSGVQTRVNCRTAKGAPDASCAISVSWDDPKNPVDITITDGSKTVLNTVVGGTSYVNSNLSLADGDTYTITMRVKSGTSYGPIYTADTFPLPAAQQTGWFDEMQGTAGQGGCSGQPTFYIGIQSGSTPGFSGESGPYLYGKDLCPGVYQINIRGTGPNHSAFQTFYVNVNAANPSLASWKQGGLGNGSAPLTNVFTTSYGDSANNQPFIPVYVYQADNPDKPGSYQPFLNNMATYASDFQTINTHLEKNSTTSTPVSTGLVGYIMYGYAKDNTFANKRFYVANPTTPDPRTQITYSGFMNNTQNGTGGYSRWIDALASQWKTTSGVSLTLNYGFTNQLKADNTWLNPKQRLILAQQVVYPTLFSSDVSGSSMDLEGGFDQLASLQLIKLVTDAEAYRAKWFGFFYFADYFNAQVTEALGPMGVALVSGYDVGAYRAPNAPITGPHSYYPTWQYGPSMSYQPNSAAAGKTIDADNPNKNFGWTAADANKFYNDFLLVDAQHVPNGCSGVRSTSSNLTNPYNSLLPVSWCNLSPQDSASENYRRFYSCNKNAIKPHGQPINAATAMQAYNGQYSLILPVSWSATEWTQAEIWKPDLSENFGHAVSSTKPHNMTVITANTATVDGTTYQCSDLSNAWFHSHESDLEAGGTSLTILKACLNGGSVSNTVGSGVPMQAVSRCGTQPYYKCIFVSALPGKFYNAVQSAPFASATAALSANITQGNQIQYLLANTIDQLYPHADKHLIGYGVYALENHAASDFSSFYLGDFGSASYNGTAPNRIVQEPWYVGGNALSGVGTCGDNSTAPNGTTILQDPYYCTTANQQYLKDIWDQMGYLEASLLNRTGAQGNVIACPKLP